MTSYTAEWVMVGWRAPDGHACILASTELESGQLDYLAATYHYRDWDDFKRRFQPQKSLTFVINRAVIVHAPTYAEALAQLLFGKQWKPDLLFPPAQLPAGRGDSADRAIVDEAWTPTTEDDPWIEGRVIEP